jgi:hypothetical protein
MNTCAQCQAPLDPTWKFCISCGTPVPADAPVATADPEGPTERRDALPQGQQPPTQQHPAEPAAKKLPSRPAMKAAATVAATTVAAATVAATAVAATPKHPKAQQTASAFGDDIPAAIRNSQDGPAAPAPRRGVNVPLIVSICLGAAGTALIVYIVILVFGTRG